MRKIISKYSTYVVLIVLLFIFYKEWQKEKAEAIRWKSNYSAAKNDTSRIVEAEVLTKKELEAEFKELAEHFDGKTKQIRYINNIVYRDTGSIIFKTKFKQVSDTFYPIGEYLYKDSCITANITLNKDSLSFDYDYTNEVKIYGFWERSKQFPKNWDNPLIRWGRKKLKAQADTKCGKIKYNKYIEILK